MSLPNPFPLPVINQTLDMKILYSPSLDERWGAFNSARLAYGRPFG
jgi:hypothetical protein